MKRLFMILSILVFIVCGCESPKLKGFSVGVIYLNTDIETTSTNNLSGYGQLSSKDNTKVEGFMPVALLNFEFE